MIKWVWAQVMIGTQLQSESLLRSRIPGTSVAEDSGRYTAITVATRVSPIMQISCACTLPPEVVWKCASTCVRQAEQDRVTFEMQLEVDMAAPGARACPISSCIWRHTRRTTTQTSSIDITKFAPRPGRRASCADVVSPESSSPAPSLAPWRGPRRLLCQQSSRESPRCRYQKRSLLDQQCFARKGALRRRMCSCIGGSRQKECSIRISSLLPELESLFT